MTYYRNNKDVTSIEGNVIDAGSLWQLKNDVLVLVDEDQYITHHLTNDFEKE